MLQPFNQHHETSAELHVVCSVISLWPTLYKLKGVSFLEKRWQKCLKFESKKRRVKNKKKSLNAGLWKLLVEVLFFFLLLFTCCALQALRKVMCSQQAEQTCSRTSASCSCRNLYFCRLPSQMIVANVGCVMKFNDMPSSLKKHKSRPPPPTPPP